MSRYRTDSKFRDSVKSSNRRTARKYYGVGGVSPSDALSIRRINRVHFGTVRTYLDKNKRIVTGVTYTVAEMTLLLGKCSKTMRLWMGDERFPKPTKVTYVKEGMHHLAVYTEEEAEAILDALIEHYKEKYQLSVEDTKTRKELLSAVYGTGAILTIPC